MKKPCRVRRAHPGDAGAIAAVINESNYQAYRSIIPRELFRYPVTSPEEILVDMGSMEFYVCEDDRGRILGVAALEPHHSEGVGVVRWVYVEPASQRRGVGTALLEHIEDRARQLGLKKAEACHA